MTPQKKNRDNYFSMNIQKFGDNFMTSKTPMDIQKDAKKRIFKDIVFGNIDYNKFGQYFTNPQFVEQLIITARNEEFNHRVIADALSMYMQNNNADDRTRAVWNREKNIAYVLFYLRTTLEQMKASNYDVGILVPLAQIIDYKFKQDFATEY